MTVPDLVFGGTLAFLFGVLAASLGWSIVFYLPIFAILGFGYLFLSHRPEAHRPFLSFLFLIFCGAFYYSFYLNLQAKLQNIIFNQKISFSGVVIEEPAVSEKYSTLTLKLQPPFSGEIRALTSPSGEFGYGDLLQIEGRVSPAGSPAEKPTVFFPKIGILAQHRGFWLKEGLLDLKNHLTGQFERFLSADEEALLAGITFGTRSNFASEFKKQMSLSGTTHLVALSGYNISILVFAIAWASGRFLSRRKTFYLTALVIVLFVLMVGAEASVVRAAIMGFLALLAKEIGRVYSARNSIALTATAMALVNPTILVYNPGFQLSFLSLLGIVYLSPTLGRLFKIEKGNFFGWQEIVLTTISAQLAVLPLVIAVFGRFSLSAFLANTLILGFVPLTMLLGFILAALSSVYIYLGFFAAKFVEILLAYEIAVIKFFAKIVLPVPLGNSWAIILTYYSILALIVYKFHLPQHESR